MADGLVFTPKAVAGKLKRGTTNPIFAFRENKNIWFGTNEKEDSLSKLKNYSLSEVN